MYIPQTELFWGLSQNMVNRIMGIARREAYQPGDVLFGSQDRAAALFILAQGQVEITMEGSTTRVYTGSRVGEAFGWGCLIGRDTYGGSAVCTTPVVVLRLDCDPLRKLLDGDTSSGYLFYRHLAQALGERLLTAYRQMAGSPAV